jgi:hypothetical protein
MSKLVPGKDGDPLPPGTLVFRVGKNAELNQQAIDQRKASEIFFKPSSADKKSAGKRLSIWVEELTIADQGWAMMGSNPAKTVIACLDVDDIAAVEPPPSFCGLASHWEQALLEDGSVNTHAGAEGHAGIFGLCQGGENNKTDRDLRKLLRSRLADQANVSPVPVPHNIPEEHISVAAYYIHEKKAGSHEAHWIAAIRQLRRSRVLAHEKKAPQCHS